MTRWNNSFYINKHRINNTGWMMKWRWREGVERSVNPNILRECWTFLVRIFLHQMRMQLSRICASKPRRNLQTFGWCLQFIPIGFYYLTFVCKNKQRNHCNWRESFKEVRLRKVQHYRSSLKEEKPLQFSIPLTLLPKNHNLFCEHKEGWNGAEEKRKIRVHQLIMQNYR